MVHGARQKISKAKDFDFFIQQSNVLNKPGTQFPAEPCAVNLTPFAATY
jgi:hypothetical protein